MKLREPKTWRLVVIFCATFLVVACGGGGGGSKSGTRDDISPQPPPPQSTGTPIANLQLDINIELCLTHDYDVWTVEEFAELAELECPLRSAVGIRTFDGIEAGSSLRRVSLIVSSYILTQAIPLDLTPIGELKELRELELYYDHENSDPNPPKIDLSALRNLEKLEKLYLELPNLSNNPILNSRHLKEVGFGYQKGAETCGNVDTEIKDLYQLMTWDPPPELKLIAVCSSQLEWAHPPVTLEALYIGSSSLKSISVNRELRSLSLHGLRSSNLSPPHWSFLSGADSLERLRLSTTTFEDLQRLSTLTNLRELIILSPICYDCPTFDDLSPLSDLKQLQTLIIRNPVGSISKGTDLAPIAIPTLEYLSLQRVPITGLDAFFGHPNLKYLHVDEPGFSLEQVAAISGLESLHLNVGTSNYPDMRDLSPLSALHKLKNLTILSQGTTKDISPLSSLANLEVLHLSSSAIDTLPDVSQLQKLKDLNISGALTEISELAALTALEHLDLSYNKITSAEPLRSLKKLKSVDLSQNNLLNADFVFALPEIADLRVSRNSNFDCEGFEALRSEHQHYFRVLSDC